MMYAIELAAREIVVPTAQVLATTLAQLADDGVPVIGWRSVATS